MNDAPSDSPSLEDIQDSIVEQLHAGDSLDHDAILAAHPGHRSALEQFLSVVDLLEATPSAPNPKPNPTPTKLGEFKIIGELGRGGMGVVYEAEQPSLRRRVALKVLPPALQNDRRLLVRFRREAEAAARLRHPGIVPVYSFGEAGGAPFFAMELVDGLSLAGILSRRRAGKDAGVPVDPDAYRAWAVETAARIADALAYAHAQGVVHRDVKPGNVLIDDAGLPKLTDFGLALDLEATSLTVSGEVFGSPRYMSPEQAFHRKHPLDARTDVYSLAVTLYELLTLRLPYEAATSTEILLALETGRHEPLRSHDPGAPEALEAVLRQALQIEPSKRYENAAAFATDLRAAVEGGLVAAPRTRRRRRLAIAALLLVAIWASMFLMVDRSPMAYEVDGVALMMPAPDDLRALADGTHPDGGELLQSWLKPMVEHRTVLARDTPGRMQAVLNAVLDDRWMEQQDPDIYAVGTLELSVDGGEWFVPEATRSVLIPVLGGAGIMSYRSEFLLGPELGEAMDRGTFRLGRRVTVRVLRLEQDRIRDNPASLNALTLEGGTTYTWRFPTQAMFVYDSYPDDYPSRLSDPEIDRSMTEAYTPDKVLYRRSSTQGTTGKSLALTLEFVHKKEHTLAPLAVLMELRDPESDELMAWEEYATRGVAGADGRTSSGLSFSLPGEATPAQQRLLLDLEAGRPRELILSIKPSREVALREPALDDYWGGTIETVVTIVARN